MQRTPRIPTPLELLLSAVLLLGLPAASGGPTAHDSFQDGWSAYEQGDYRRAVGLWLPLAEQGYVNAQINLAAMYEQGYGVDRDLQKAADWYRAAAGQDSAIGQYNLGLFLAEHGGAQSATREGLRWIAKAANQGFVDAQLQLGLMYARGLAGEARLAEAPHWLYQAGLGYLSGDDAAGVASAVSALQGTPAGRPLARDLEARLASWPGRAGTAAAAPRTAAGSAWPVAAGYVVTSHHIVAGKGTLVLVDSRGAEIAARLAASDAENDIALLAVGDLRALPPALPLSATAARLGATVFTIGFPRADVMGTTPKLSLGIISSVNGMRDDPASYQISVPIQPGNSGGPLLNMRGEVVGLVTAMLGRVRSTGGAEPFANIGYALKIDRVAALLRTVPQPAPRIDELAGGTGSLEDLAQRIQGSVMMVRAE
ncbi:MAG: tetratricopeptide repeat-containing serine protease family protein [Gammaproteobacteria bacterium]